MPMVDKPVESIWAHLFDFPMGSLSDDPFIITQKLY